MQFSKSGVSKNRVRSLMNADTGLHLQESEIKGPELQPGDLFSAEAPGDLQLMCKVVLARYKHNGLLLSH